MASCSILSFAWARVDELDERLLAQQVLLQRCQLEADREALGELQLQMA